MKQVIVRDPKLLVYIIFVGLVLLIAGCSQPIQSSPSVSDEEYAVSLKREVIAPTKGLDYHFDRTGDFSETYMLFGATDFSRSDLPFEISLSGIKLDKAMSIYERYPDFYKCKSPGAAVAQKALLSLHIIPEDPEVLDILRNAVSQFEKNLRNDGDRIFVELEGEVLKNTSVIMRKVNGDVTDQIPSNMRRGYYLVKSAKIIEAKIVLKN